MLVLNLPRTALPSQKGRATSAACTRLAVNEPRPVKGVRAERGIAPNVLPTNIADGIRFVSNGLEGFTNRPLDLGDTEIGAVRKHETRVVFNQRSNRAPRMRAECPFVFV